ncbi:unnamed protein product, partial [Amoebophrya sp. A25]
FYTRQAVRIQAFYRGRATRKGYERLRAAAHVLQCLFRMLIWRRWFLGLGASTNVLQKHWRRWWLKQTAQMAMEGTAFDFVEGDYVEMLDYEQQDGSEETKVEESNNVSNNTNTAPTLGGIPVGSIRVLGLQGQSRSRLAAFRTTLERLNTSTTFHPIDLVLGDKRSLALCYQFPPSKSSEGTVV